MKIQPVREGYISVNGGRLWHRVFGAGPGVPLLALHGGPGANSDYLDPLPALADERPVILYDQWYHSLLPGSEMIVFEHSAHMAHLEEPECYLTVLHDFLHRVESRMPAIQAVTDRVRKEPSP